MYILLRTYPWRLSQGTYVDEPNEERELTMEFSPNNKPVLGTPRARRDHPSVGLASWPSTSSVTDGRLTEQRSAGTRLQPCCEKGLYHLSGISNRLGT